MDLNISDVELKVVKEGQSIKSLIMERRPPSYDRKKLPKRAKLQQTA